jgi:flagellar basal body rod protein FlgG
MDTAKLCVVMNVSLYQAASALNANARWQEIISQNLAASAVPGFKRQDLSFSAVAAAQAPNVMMPEAANITNFQQGQIRPTSVATDVAIDGNGFFEVQLPGGQTGYTRDGELKIESSGQLVTKQGYPVQGDGGPIQLDLNNPAPISIGADGSVSQGGELKGQLKVVAFNEPRLLTPVGANYFVAKDPGLLPEPSSASVRQGFLEASNTSPVAEMAQLIAAMRHYEANQRVIQSQDERMGRAISELGNPGA